MDHIVDFLFETGMLAKTPRSGFFFLGSGEQSVAEHVNRVCYLGFVLASMEKEADMNKVMKMCLFHDLAEARVSDLNYVHQKYNSKREDLAIEDLTRDLPFGDEIQAIIAEYEKRESLEALLAKDADNLELLLSLKEQADIGNARAIDWMQSTVKRLKTNHAQQLAEKITQTDSDRWWYGDKNADWWVNRNAIANK